MSRSSAAGTVVSDRQAKVEEIRQPAAQQESSGKRRKRNVEMRANEVSRGEDTGKCYGSNCI